MATYLPYTLESSPWTAAEHYDACAYRRFGPRARWDRYEPPCENASREDWIATTSNWFVYAVRRVACLGQGLQAFDQFRSLRYREALAHADDLASQNLGRFEVLEIAVSPMRIP